MKKLNELINKAEGKLLEYVGAIKRRKLEDVERCIAAIVRQISSVFI